MFGNINPQRPIFAFEDAMIEPMAVIPAIVTPIRLVLLPWSWSRPAMTLPSRRLHSPSTDAGSASAMKPAQDDMA
ncbi:hypothetical protein [Dentiradicibacter hellwigii]|uniref:Uncharacterized protein n=1 Tax=Dentiradicibacter hellwigii TaxID=3149053 RepID=A0ABV4UDL2_9RHOO